MKRFFRRVAALLPVIALVLIADAAACASSAIDLPSILVARDPIAWDNSLAVSAADAVERYRKHQGLILVDVRSESDHTLARIPGAMHIPLAFVHTKTFLKGRPFILVGNGHDSVPLLKACRDLQSRRFKARLLAGGIQGWLAAEGPLEGNPAALIPRREMRPEAFFREKDIEGRLVLYVAGDDERQDGDAFLPYALHITPEENPAQIKKMIAAARPSAGDAADLPPLVFTPDGRGHDRIAARLARAGCAPVLFLEGGLAAYRTYLTGTLQARRPREERLKTVGGCQGCGPVDASEVK